MKPCYLACVLVSSFIFMRKQGAAWLTLKATVQCSRHSSAHPGRCTSGSRKLRFLWIMRDFAYGWITEQPILVRGRVCRDTYNTETVLFTMFLAFVLNGPKSGTWCPIEHEANRCTFWTSSTGVSWKRPFFCIMRTFGYSSLAEMQILVGRVLNTGTESAMKMSYLGHFCLIFLPWMHGEQKATL